MALSHGRESYFRVNRETSYEESISDGRERGIAETQDGCKYCRNNTISDKDLKIFVTVAALAMLLSVAAVTMVTIQWVKMRDLQAVRQLSETMPTEDYLPAFNDVGVTTPVHRKANQILSPDDVTVPEQDCATCRMRRDEKGSTASRRARTRHRKCNNDCHITGIFSHNHTTAIHFQGFPPGVYHLGQDGAYVWWRPTAWYRHMTGFHYNHSNGHVTVRSPGLYFIYSQMVHTENIGQTYAIVVNNNIFLKCIKSAPVTDQSSTYEASCYTAGVTVLNRNDQVWIRGIHTSGHVTLRPESTYWGLIHLRTLYI